MTLPWAKRRWADYVLPTPPTLNAGRSWVAAHAITKSSPHGSPVGTSDPATGGYTGLPNAKTLDDILIGLGNAMNALTAAFLSRRGAMRGITGAKPSPTWPPKAAGRAATMLARGGRFDDDTLAYDGEKPLNRFGGRIHFSPKSLATKHDSMTGQWLDGMA